jgi:hypothetical protein
MRLLGFSKAEWVDGDKENRVDMRTQHEDAARKRTGKGRVTQRTQSREHTESTEEKLAVSLI